GFCLVVAANRALFKPDRLLVRRGTRVADATRWYISGTRGDVYAWLSHSELLVICSGSVHRYNIRTHRYTDSGAFQNLLRQSGTGLWSIQVSPNGRHVLWVAMHPIRRKIQGNWATLSVHSATPEGTQYVRWPEGTDGPFLWFADSNQW